MRGNKQRRPAALWMLIFMLIVQVIMPGSALTAGETDGLVLNLTTNKAVVDSGEEFSYYINYSASSTVSNFTAPEIRFTLPAGVTYTGKSDSAITTSSINPSHTEVVFRFNGGMLPAGSTGQLIVRAKFENYVTPDATAATAEAEFHATVSGNPATLVSNPATVTSNGTAAWAIEKTKLRPIPNPFKGGDVEYEIVLRESTATANGRLDSTNMVVTDTLPAGAVFVSATLGGTPGPGNTVVWNLGDNLRGIHRMNVIVNYPTGLPDTEVTNRVEAEFTPLGQARTSVSHQVTHGFETMPTDLNTRIEKWVEFNERERSPGQTVMFHISEFNSKANIPLTSAVIEDMTPQQTVAGTPINFQLQSITTAVFKDIPTYDVYYTLSKTPAAGDWVHWQTVSGTTASTLDATLIGDIKGVQFRFGTVPISAFQSTNFDLVYLIPADFDVPDNGAETIDNVAKLSYVFNGINTTISDNTRFDIVDDRPLLWLEKSTSKTTLKPMEATTYTLRVTNTAYSSDTLDNPSILDLLPAELEYVPGSWTITKPAGVTADPQFTQTVQPDGTTRLNWFWDGTNPASLPIGQMITITFDARVKAGVEEKTIVNKMQVTSPHYLNNLSFKNKKCPTCAVDGYYTVEQPVNVAVIESTALQAEMWIKGELDSDWSRYPDSGTTTPGGRSLYRLEIQNVGNVPTKDLKIINTFPRIGDRGVLSTAGRSSQWGPLLTGELLVPDYVTAFYSTTPGVTMDSTTGADNGVWTTTPPADLTSVTAIKFEFDADYVINPTSLTTLEWPMVAPVGAPTGGEVAWNSFGYKMNKASGGSILPAEPLKVGIKIQSSPNGSLGDTVWLDTNENGVQDGGETGVNGIRVELYDELGNKLSETLTGNDFTGNPGKYLFPDLDAGNYRVAFLPPAAYESGSSGPLVLGAGQQDDTVDYGLVPKRGKIGDRVWLDENNNGVLDAGESGVNGVQADLYNGTGTLLATTTTSTLGGVDGSYLFEGLVPGDYQVRFTLPDPAYTFTNLTGGATAVVTLAQGEENMTLDAGVYQPPALPPVPPIPPVGPVLLTGSIGDRVWIDTNQDGVQDANEPGQNGVTVTLYKEQNQRIATTVTASRNGQGGYYLFEGLEPGSYQVQFTAPDDTYLFTKAGQGAASGRDSDADPATGRTAVIQLGIGENKLDVDAGLITEEPLPISLANIRSFVWFDLNANGIQDPNEQGLDGVTVELYDAAGRLIATTKTFLHDNKQGYYEFLGLPQGDYRLKFVVPTGYAFTKSGAGEDSNVDSDPNGTGWTATITLGEGETNLSIGAGLVQAERTVPGKPGVPAKPNPTTEGKPQAPADPSTGNMLPQTGEQAPVLPWVGLVLCLLAGSLLFIRKYA